MACGQALVWPCPRCGQANPPEAHFCLRCGTPLGEAALVERRVTSVLFADVVASTSLAQRRDPEAMRAIVARYFATMREEIERHGGVVEKFIGDAVMAVFGLPAAHEDDPQRAVRAALAMQARLPALNAQLGIDLHLRIGISTGEVVADPRAVAAGQLMVTGEVVNLASRLQEDAPADGIAVDDRTARATRPAVEFRPLPPAAGEFAGQARWLVTGVAAEAAAHRLRAGMVGREDEVQFLLAVYRRAVEGRRLHVVTVIGQAGVGKSRLVAEWLDRLRAIPPAPAILRGRCPAYGEGLTYRPLAEALRADAGIKENEPPAVAADRLRAHLRAAAGGSLRDDHVDAVAADLVALLGSPVAPRPGAPDLRAPGDGLFRSLRAFLAARARRQPVVVVIEDLHWAEETLLDLLRQLAARGTDGPVLLVGLARPELLERHPDWGAGLRNATTVSLAPLPDDAGERLVTALLKGAPPPADVRAAVLARAEGNPLFIQEILRMLIEGGWLVRDEAGWRWGTYPRNIQIPDTIHGILASRLDLLSPLEKHCVQDAAVVGRTFWLGALVATSELTAAEAIAALTRLQERDLVEERSASSIAGEREFAFTHALVREVAYTTLPKARRSASHLRFARWLERTAGPEHGDVLPALAHHYEHAWRYRFETGDRAPELARGAVDVLRRAAIRAVGLRAFPEARRFCDRALAVLENAGLEGDVALLLELLVLRTEGAKWTSRPDLVLKDTDTVIRLAPTVGRDDLLARAWLNRAFAEYDRLHLQLAEDALRVASDLFERLQDRRGRGEALEILGAITEDLRGRLSTAQDAYRQALALYRELGDGQGMARTMAWYGRAIIDAGRLDEAHAVLEEALALARAHHERISEAYALAAQGVLAHLAGTSPAAVQKFQEAIAIRQALGDPLSEAATRRHLGMHLLRQGRLDEAEREFETARAIRRAHGARTEATNLLRGLAEVALARGDLLAAAEYAEQALAGVQPPDEMLRASHLATLARIRAAQGRAADAEELFRESLAIVERREYRIDLALTWLKYGEALALLGHADRARAALERARALFAEMGATNFVREADRRLPSLRT